MKYAIPFFLALLAFAAFGGAQEGFWRVADVGGRDGLVALDGATRFFAGCCHVHPRGSFSHALGYSPYGRFCATNYPSPAAWADETAARLRDWGFNALGAACDLKVTWRTIETGAIYVEYDISRIRFFVFREP